MAHAVSVSKAVSDDPQQIALKRLATSIFITALHTCEYPLRETRGVLHDHMETTYTRQWALKDGGAIPMSDCCEIIGYDIDAVRDTFKAIFEYRDRYAAQVKRGEVKPKIVRELNANAPGRDGRYFAIPDIKRIVWKGIKNPGRYGMTNGRKP